jgi:predicted ATPase
MFKHAMTQDVAYSSLLRERRKDLHRLIGLAIEELYRNRLAEHYEVLAHHYVAAEAWEKALEYLLKVQRKPPACSPFGRLWPSSSKP